MIHKLLKNVDVEVTEDMTFTDTCKKVLVELEKKYNKDNTITHDDLVQAAYIMSIYDEDVEIIKDGIKTISINVV